MMAVNTDVTTEKSFTKRQLKQTAVHSEPMLEVVEIEEAELAKQIFHESDQPFKKRMLAFHNLHGHHDGSPRINLKNAVAVDAVKEVEDVSGETERKVYGQDKTDCIDNRVNDDGKNNQIIKAETIEEAQVDRDGRMTSTGDVKSVRQVVEVQMAVDMPGQSDQNEISKRSVLVSEVANQNEFVVGQNFLPPGVPQHQDERTEKRENTDQIQKPTSEKAVLLVEDVKVKPLVNRSSSCPEGALASGCSGTMDCWPLTTTEETKSFFITHGSSDAHDKNYPSTKNMDEMVAYFKHHPHETGQSTEWSDPLSAETMGKARYTLPPEHQLAFGSTLPEKDPILRLTHFEKLNKEPELETMDTTISPQNLKPVALDPADDLWPPISQEKSEEFKEFLRNKIQSDFGVILNQIQHPGQIQSNTDTLEAESKNQPPPRDEFRKTRRRMTNRIAARKCRMKQQERESQLKKLFQEYECKNTRLNYEVKELQKIKESLEQILTKHEHSKTCKLQNKLQVTEERIEKSPVKIPVAVTRENSKTELNIDTQRSQTNAVKGAKDSHSGLLQRRTPSFNPQLPKLKMLAPDVQAIAPKETEKRNEKIGPVSTAAVPQRINKDTITSVQPPVVVKTDSMGIKPISGYVGVLALPTSHDVVRPQGQDSLPAVPKRSPATDVLHSKVEEKKIVVGKTTKNSKMSSLKTAQIRQVNAEQLKKILKKGGKVVLAKDKEGREVPVDNLFKETFKRPLDFKPLVKNQVKKLCDRNGESDDFYKKGKLAAAQGKSIARNPYLYKQAVAAYAAKNGLGNSSREQVLAHVQAKHRAQHSQNTPESIPNRPESSLSSSALPSSASSTDSTAAAHAETNTSEVKVQGNTVHVVQPSGHVNPVGRPTRLKLAAGHVPAPPIVPTEPMFKTSGIVKVMNYKLNQQGHELKETSSCNGNQAEQIPQTVSVRNGRSRGDITKLTLANGSQSPQVQQVVYSLGDRQVNQVSLLAYPNRRLTESQSRSVSSRVVHQSSPVTTPHNAGVQPVYLIPEKTIQDAIKVTYLDKDATVNSVKDSLKSRILNRTSSITPIKPKYTSEINNHKPVIQSPSLSSTEAQDTSLAVSALLQLKSGVGDRRANKITATTEAKVSQSIVSAPVSMPSQVSAVPQRVYLYPTSHAPATLVTSMQHLNTIVAQGGFVLSQEKDK